MLTTSSASLAERYRGEFPVTENLIYLNHAAVAPLSRRSANAMKSLADDVLQYGSYHYDQWLDAYQGVRVAAARLAGAEPDEIALVKNTSEGIAMIANGISWKTGDRIVAFEGEFPANFWPWKRLEKHGVRIEFLRPESSLDQIEAAAKGARLLAISFVQFLSGFKADLEAIGAICQRHGCFLFVDAIQGLGAVPLDVRRMKIGAFAADGHKWLLGPEGCGILFVSRELLDVVEPVEFGWTNTADFNSYGVDPTLRPDAGRYECGTLNTIGLYGLRAAFEFLLEVGLPEITSSVLDRADQIYRGVREKGYQPLGVRTPENAAGIVSFRHPQIDSRKIVRDLKDHRILAAPRQGWVRTSPHFYISEADIQQLLAMLPAI